MLKPPKLSLSKSDRLRLAELQSALSHANDLFGLLSQDTQRLVERTQNPVASLPYCLRWGLKACEELMAESSATSDEEIWLQRSRLAKSLKLRPSTVNQMIQRKLFVPMVRQGTEYFGLLECREALKRNGGIKA